VDPDPEETGLDSDGAGLDQLQAEEGSSRPGAGAGQEEGGRSPGQALERQGGDTGTGTGTSITRKYGSGSGWVGSGAGGRGLAAARGSNMARKAGRKFGSASRLVFNFQ